MARKSALVPPAEIALYPPQDVKSLPEMHNPLGIFIEEVQWAERTRSTP